MNQEKLNLIHPISDISGSSASVFTISGVMYEGPEGVFLSEAVKFNDILTT